MAYPDKAPNHPLPRIPGGKWRLVVVPLYMTNAEKLGRTVGIQIWCMRRFLGCESLPHCVWGGLYHVYFMIWFWQAIWSNLVALNARENIICFNNLSCRGPVHWIRASSDAKVYRPVMGGHFAKFTNLATTVGAMKKDYIAYWGPMSWIVGTVWPPRNLPLGLMSYLGDLLGLLQCHPLPNCRPKILTLWWDPFPEELGAQYLIIFKLVQYEVILKFHPKQSTDVWVIVHVNKRTIKTGPELMVYPRH